MRSYALIDTSSHLVVNSIVLDEQADWPFTEGFIVVQTDIASIGWSYVDGVFSPPTVPALTPEEITAANQSVQASLLSSAALYLAQVVSSINFANPADPCIGAAKEWQAYYLALQSVDPSVPDVIWPLEPAKIG